MCLLAALPADLQLRFVEDRALRRTWTYFTRVRRRGAVTVVETSAEGLHADGPDHWDEVRTALALVDGKAVLELECTREVRVRDLAARLDPEPASDAAVVYATECLDCRQLVLVYDPRAFR